MKLNIMLIFFILGPLFAQDDSKVAKALIVRGKVSYHHNGSHYPVNAKSWLPIGAVIKTSKKSFVKLIFIDKSQMNLGPESEIKIKAFPRKKAGIVNLIKGQLRAKVSKDYLEIKGKEKDKLYIRTQSAAMGVRGTDFQVNFNTENKRTSLITFSGAVAMAKIDQERNWGHQNLGARLASREVVIVKKGQFSGADPDRDRATLPVKISPTQLEILKNNDLSIQGSKRGKLKGKESPKMRSIIPPGVSGDDFMTGHEGIKKELGQNIGQGIIETVEKKVQITKKTEQSPPPQGFYDAKTKAYAPPAGGYVDMDTALYIPPAEGSYFDDNSGTYTPSAAIGSIDHESGDYNPPSGFNLTSQGEFIAIKESAERTIASISTKENHYTIGSKEEVAPVLINSQNIGGAEDQKLVEELAKERDEDVTRLAPPPLPSNFSKVNFRFILP